MRCPKCNTNNDEDAATCQHCGVSLPTRKHLPVTHPAATPANQVTVVDIDMPFMSLVSFLVKLVLAAIPAMIIAAIIVAAITMLFAGMFTGLR